LRTRICRFRDLTIADAEICERYGLKDTRDWKVSVRRRMLSEKSNWDDFLTKCLYRPFDFRAYFHHEDVVELPRNEVTRHLLKKENLAIITTRQTRDEWATLMTSYIPDHKSCAAYDTNSLFPLYLYPAQEGELFEQNHWPAGKGGRVPDLSREFVEEFAEKIKLEFVSDGVGDLKETFGPEDIFHYIYAVFHSPEYRRRYAEFLKIDFPRVPLPKSKPLFRKLCKVGEKLTKLHLMEAPILEDDKKRPEFPVEGNSVVEKGYPKHVAHKARVYINKDQYFEGVSPDVWEFHIGGYQVCEKWLKDRRQRTLSYEDIRHYQKIVVALGETIRLMKEPCLAEMLYKNM